jgi:hypothetical protein
MLLDENAVVGIVEEVKASEASTRPIARTNDAVLVPPIAAVPAGAAYPPSVTKCPSAESESPPSVVDDPASVNAVSSIVTVLINVPSNARRSMNADVAADESAVVLPVFPNRTTMNCNSAHVPLPSHTLPALAAPHAVPNAAEPLPVHAPPSHVSTSVHAFESSHLAPSPFVGLLQLPVKASHVPTSWH